MTTINSASNQVRVNVSLEAFGIAASVTPQVAASAAELLAAFNFATGFSANDLSALTAGQNANQFSGLANQPQGFSATSVQGAFGVFVAGFGMSADLSYGGGQGGVHGHHHHHHHHHDWSLGGMGGFGYGLHHLEMADRLNTMQARELVGQVGVMAKDLAGMLAPQKPAEVDKFATGQTCRTGKHNPSNLTNADHITLAIYDILKTNQDKGINAAGRPGGMSHEALAKQLEEKYGIKAEVTKVKSKEGDELKALKFEGGQVFADGAGDGQADLGDYDFTKAIGDIASRTGMTRESFAAGAGEYKIEQKELTKLRTDLKEFTADAEKLYKKLGDDFEKRWGYKLPEPQLPPWLSNLLDEGNQTSTANTNAGGRELFQGGLNEAYGVFAFGFVFAFEVDTKKKKEDILGTGPRPGDVQGRGPRPN